MSTTSETAAPVAQAKPKIPDLPLHPLCEIIPPCTEKEFEELKKDIRENGLQVPIKTFEGKILDGRSRYKACLELEKEGHPVDFRRDYFTGDANAAVAYVISINVKRRHLSASQRSLIAARLVTSQLGGDRLVKLPTEVTQDQVAALAGVSKKMVTDAKAVLDYRETNPDLAKKVLDGELAVNKAAEQVRKEKEEKEGKGKTTPN
jgi:ParB-like chromosome segregation protein Spo0J